eukprot:3699633-Pyramimonas_sp.AAC.1
MMHISGMDLVEIDALAQKARVARHRLPTRLWRSKAPPPQVAGSPLGCAGSFYLTVRYGGAPRQSRRPREARAFPDALS